MNAVKFFLIAASSAPLAAHGAPAAVAPVDPFVSMRAIVAPALACERAFDAERRRLADEKRKVDAMPARTGAELRQWQAAWDSQVAKENEFKTRRGVACKTEAAFERMKARLAQLRSDLTPGDVHSFALGFFHELRRTAEYASDFAAGYNARQYSPPPAPPPPSR